MLPSLLGCPLSLKTANVGNPGLEHPGDGLNCAVGFVRVARSNSHRVTERSTEEFIERPRYPGRTTERRSIVCH